MSAETWDKFYSVYMFDNIKYHKLCKQFPNESREELKNKCYVLDESNNRIYLGDARNIYRVKTLHQVQELLATYCMNLRNKIKNYWDLHCSAEVKFNDFTFYYERYDKGSYVYYTSPNVKTVTKNTPQLSLFEVEKPSNVFEIRQPHEICQVELNNTWQMSIKDRLKLHIAVLRLCRKGVDIRIACKSVLENCKV